MDPKLLNLPLAVKIPVAPESKPVFCRGKLGEKLYQPFPYFTLDDPYCHHLSTAYNCLHDPILRDYHKRKDILRMLKKQGFVTSDNKVICTVKEFNDYRQYRTKIKLESEKLLKRKKAKLKDGPNLPGTTKNSRQMKQRLQPQKPSNLPPPKSRKSGGCRNWGAALDKGQTYSRTQLGQKDSQRKPDGTANCLLSVMFEQPTAAEAKKLEELVETVVQRVLVRLKIPGNQNVSFLKRAARGIRRRLLGSCLRAELSDTSLDHHQKMEVIAKEIVATVLDILGDRLASSISKAAETGGAASGEEVPRVGRATQADKSEDTETATAGRALSQSSLDTLTREVVENVHCTLESLVTSQFEQDSGSEYSEIRELRGGNRQLQPSQTLPRQDMKAGQGFPRASEQQSLKAMLPAPAERSGCAKTTEPEDCAMVNLERKMNLESTASANTLDIRPMANRIADSVLERISQSRPAPAPEENFQWPVRNPPSFQGRTESCAAEDTPPPVDLSNSQSMAQSRVPKVHLRQVRCVMGELKQTQTTSLCWQ